MITDKFTDEDKAVLEFANEGCKVSMERATEKTGLAESSKSLVTRPLESRA